MEFSKKLDKSDRRYGVKKNNLHLLKDQRKQRKDLIMIPKAPL